MVKLTHSITLSTPLAIMKDGAATTVDSLTLTRPKTRHVKVLGALIGPELLKALLAGPDQPSAADQVNMIKLATEVLPSLLDIDKLDRFLALIADLASISDKEIGETDPGDFLEILKGFMSFFPALQSIVLKSIQPT